MGLEKRKFPRIKGVLPLDYQIDQESFSLFNETRNVSKSGAYIVISDQLAVGLEFDLVFSLFGDDLNKPMNKVLLKGQAIRIEKLENDLFGIGVNFYNCKKNDWELLEKAIHASHRFNLSEMADSSNNRPIDACDQKRIIRMYSNKNPKNAPLNKSD